MCYNTSQPVAHNRRGATDPTVCPPLTVESPRHAREMWCSSPHNPVGHVALDTNSAVPWHVLLRYRKCVGSTVAPGVPRCSRLHVDPRPPPPRVRHVSISFLPLGSPRVTRRGLANDALHGGGTAAWGQGGTSCLGTPPPL